MEASLGFGINCTVYLAPFYGQTSNPGVLYSLKFEVELDFLAIACVLRGGGLSRHINYFISKYLYIRVHWFRVILWFPGAKDFNFYISNAIPVWWLVFSTASRYFPLVGSRKSRMFFSNYFPLSTPQSSLAIAGLGRRNGVNIGISSTIGWQQQVSYESYQP